MAKKLKTLTTRLVSSVLVVHAVLLPVLFQGLLHIVEQSHKEMFIDHVRTFTRFLADNFEENGLLIAEQRVIDVLDSAMLSSNCVYSELWEANSALYNPTVSQNPNRIYQEDFSFGGHGDHVYYLSIPILIPNRQIVLRLGFDEQSTIDHIQAAYTTGIYVLAIYFCVSLLFVIVLGLRLTHPLRTLQYASRDIASGLYSKKLITDSKILEIDEMAKDLELMRSELVGMNERLKDEINQRLDAELRKKALEDQLFRSQKIEMIGTLAGGIAHEFNNILVPILLYTEIALDELPKDSPIGVDLNRVLNSAHRAKSLIQQILTFSRQIPEKEYELVDIKNVMRESLSLLRAVIPATIEIRQHLEGDFGKFLGVESQIQQLIINLCSNAAQAIDHNTGVIEITLSQYEVSKNEPKKFKNLPPGKFITLSVSDSGHGMDKATLEHIFEPFFTTKEVGQGSGLGLSVVHGIVSSHGGEITVFSTPNKGSTFCIYFPLLSKT